jgi:glutamine synthetase
MLSESGVWRIDSGIDAIMRYSDPKNTALFSELAVSIDNDDMSIIFDQYHLQILSPEECVARQNIMLEHYIGTVSRNLIL